MLFDKTIVLDQIMRQNGDDEDSRRFKNALSELRDFGADGISDDAVHLLQSRIKHRLSTDEVQQFSSALHLYPHKKEVRAHNLASLRRTARPVVRVNSVHQPDTARARGGTDNDFDGLVSELCLAEGAPLMLTTTFLLLGAWSMGQLGIYTV